MILVLTGTQHIPFDRLVNGVIDYARVESGEKIVIQLGGFSRRYPVPDNVEVFDFRSQDEINELIVQSRLVITHGGTGSIIAPLYLKKKVIVMPRLSIFGEHNDDHQLDIAKRFEEEELILLWDSNENLKNLVARSEKFVPIGYESNIESMLSSLKYNIDKFMSY